MRNSKSGWVCAALTLGLVCAEVQAEELCVERSGCGGAVMCAVPADRAERGPWAVGARTVTIQGLKTEIWYPASQGSQRGASPRVYDIRQQLPVSEQAKIPEEDAPFQHCDCYGDLPLDAAHGPYPIVLFAHGTGGFRTQSLHLMVHLASRGFVVVAADHPGLYLGDLLSFQMNAAVAKNVDAIMSALSKSAPGLEFLAGHLQIDRIAALGHSSGGRGIEGFGSRPGVRVVAVMAAEGVTAGAFLKSALILGAVNDKVVPYTKQQDGYRRSPSPKRLLGIGNAGHLVFSDLCTIKNDKGQDMPQIAVAHGVKNAQLAYWLWDGCKPEQIDPAVGWRIVQFAVTGTLEPVLQCDTTEGIFTGIQERFPEISESQAGP